nr:Mariner Mos1 transposase [Hymenolepis microstoma]
MGTSSCLEPRRDVERRLFACEQLLLERQSRKGFLYPIVTRDEKWNSSRCQSSGIIFRNVEMRNGNSPAALSRCCFLSLSPHSPRSMAHGLADQHFSSYEEVKNWAHRLMDLIER